jgi:hypothetical protein
VAVVLGTEEGQRAQGLDFPPYVALRIEHRKGIGELGSRGDDDRRHRSVQLLEQRVGELERVEEGVPAAGDNDFCIRRFLAQRTENLGEAGVERGQKGGQTMAEARGLAVTAIDELTDVVSPHGESDRADVASMGAKERDGGIQLAVGVRVVKRFAQCRPCARPLDERRCGLARAAEVDDRQVRPHLPQAGGEPIDVTGVVGGCRQTRTVLGGLIAVGDRIAQGEVVRFRGVRRSGGRRRAAGEDRCQNDQIDKAFRHTWGQSRHVPPCIARLIGTDSR